MKKTSAKAESAEVGEEELTRSGGLGDETAGVLLALRKGIHLGGVRSPIPTLRHGLGRAAGVEKRVLRLA
jgi:hypothetical protein